MLFCFCGKATECGLNTGGLTCFFFFFFGVGATPESSLMVTMDNSQDYFITSGFHGCGPKTLFLDGRTVTLFSNPVHVDNPDPFSTAMPGSYSKPRIILRAQQVRWLPNHIHHTASSPASQQNHNYKHLRTPAAWETKGDPPKRGDLKGKIPQRKAVQSLQSLVRELPR